ncbi:hypothetical protein ACWEOI_12005 [Nocardia sp. NPDC004340]
MRSRIASVDGRMPPPTAEITAQLPTVAEATGQQITDVRAA